ncbi:MAG: Outer membrane lipoprotein-related protein [Candidatus Tokpelaia hoelldobleri]|uniref:Outer membrane lipoprotein-related protein n=1 Tax=Candidatus Tokpelaia hoelldobleri TaxID=1902579 RepID=A0A1U9JVX7_9HYPH|nr:MAG: Outer membrane lipoprotein-related protein [Candidatus Tokpelaia hoelldoblerii]
MKNTAIIALCLGLAALVAGCVHPVLPVSTKPSGKKLVAALSPGLTGQSFKALSAKERGAALAAEYKALEYARAGETVRWGTEGQGAWGTVVPRSPYQVGSLNCRQYSHNFTIQGLPQTVYGSACRNPDGSWVLL